MNVLLYAMILFAKKTDKHSHQDNAETKLPTPQKLKQALDEYVIGQDVCQKSFISCSLQSL